MTVHIKRISTVVLAVALLASIVACAPTVENPALVSPTPTPTPVPAFDVVVLDEVTIRIPGFDADLILSDVYSFYKRSDSDEKKIRSNYTFYFPEGKGSVYCEKPANILLSPCFWFDTNGQVDNEKSREMFESGKTSMDFQTDWLFEMPAEWFEWDGKMQCSAIVDISRNKPDYSIPYSSGGKATFSFSIGEDYDWNTTITSPGEKRPLEDLMVTTDSTPTPAREPIPVLDSAIIRIPGFDADIILTDTLEVYSLIPVSDQSVLNMYRVFFADGKGSITCDANCGVSWNVQLYDVDGKKVENEDVEFITSNDEIYPDGVIFTIPDELFEWEGTMYLEGVIGIIDPPPDNTDPDTSRGQLFFTFNIGEGDFAYGSLSPIEEIIK